MRVCTGDMVILELAIHGRFDSRTYEAVQEKDAMNTAVVITPIKTQPIFLFVTQPASRCRGFQNVSGRCREF